MAWDEERKTLKWERGRQRGKKRGGKRDREIGVRDERLLDKYLAKQ